MTRRYRSYTDDEIIEQAKNVYSLAGLLKILNLKIAGGNYANMKRTLQHLNVDTSHWTGRAWNKGQQLKDWSQYTRAFKLKPHIIKDRGHKCEKCKRKKWLSKFITLELHHINGDRTDNRLENLQLLCPNCHATTDNWRNR